MFERWFSLLKHRLQSDPVGAGAYKVIATGQLVNIHPASVLSNRKPGCIVFEELVLTTRQYARTITAVDPKWLPELAPHFFLSSVSAD